MTENHLTEIKPHLKSDEKLISVLEEMLADAKSGKIRSFVGVAFHRDTEYGKRYIHDALNLQGVGAVYVLLAWMTRAWDEVEQPETYKV